MPNCFQFIDKKTGQAEKFPVIDDKIRELVGAEPDPKRYYRGWYDALGEEAAYGWDFKRMIEARPELQTSTDPGDVELLKILTWLDENYTTTAWYSPK
jgi:hypothetical protein